MAKKRRRTRKQTKSNLSKFSEATKRFKKKKLGSLRNKTTKPRIDPLWTLDKGITYSLLSKFQNCRHRFHIENVQGWKSKKINVPLYFGNMFHHMVEAQDRGIELEYMKTISDNYLDGILADRPDLDTATIRDLAMCAAIATITFEEYVKQWDEYSCLVIKDKSEENWYYERDFEWIGKEIDFSIPHRLPNGMEVLLRGKQDGQFSVRGVEGNWLLETKTKGMIDEDGISKGLHRDMQTGLYMHAMRRLHKGAMPMGVLYNVIRRTSLKPRVADTPEIYAKRVREDIQKRPDFYFMRWTRQVTQYELDQFVERILNPSIYQLVKWWKSVERNPMNPFETTCDCIRPEADAIPFATEDCSTCKGAGVIPNMEHYERAFGNYDGMTYTQRGDFFEIITEHNYFSYEQKKYAFPELEEEDDLDQYLVGIPK